MKLVVKLLKLKEEALKNGDMAKAEFCNRESVNVAGYILKKDIDKMTLEEFKELKSIYYNKEMLQKAKEIYKQTRAE